MQVFSFYNIFYFLPLQNFDTASFDSAKLHFDAQRGTSFCHYKKFTLYQNAGFLFKCVLKVSFKMKRTTGIFFILIHNNYLVVSLGFELKVL